MRNPDNAPMDDFEIADPLPGDDETPPEGWEEENVDEPVVDDTADEGAANLEEGEEPFTSAS
jgi:hypothetical protein